MKRLLWIVSASALASASFAQSHVAHPMGMQMARYGGPAYMGAPALGVTAALLKAGGGAGHFSIATALTSMVGKETVNAEVGKLTKQYGKARVGKWIAIFDYAVADAVKYAVAAKVKLPA